MNISYFQIFSHPLTVHKNIARLNSPGYPKRCVNKIEALLSHRSTLSDHFLLYSLGWIVVPTQKTYGHTHTQHTHTNMSQSYMDIHIYIYIYIYIVTLHKHLSQDKSLFYAHVTLGKVWHLTLCKISLNQDSYFGHMVLANNVGVNLELDSSPTLVRGFPVSLSHTPTKSFVFLPPQITESMDF